MRGAALGTLAFFIFLAVFCFASTYAEASTDAERLARWAPVAEAAVAHETRCPDVRYRLRANRLIDRVYPPVPVPGKLLVTAGMATDHRTYWRFYLPPCTVWLRANFDRETLYHEVLHTAGYEHTRAMRVKLRGMLAKRRPPNIRAYSGYVTNRTQGFDTRGQTE
jgi:hypothetical protein